LRHSVPLPLYTHTNNPLRAQRLSVYAITLYKNFKMIDEPFEYLSFGGTFSRTFGAFIDCFDVFMSLSGVVLIPYAALNLTMGIFLASVYIREEEIPDFHPKHIPMVVLILSCQVAAYTFVTVVGRAAIIRAVGLMYIGQRPTWMSCLRAAFDKWRPLMAANGIIYASLVVGILLPNVLIFVAFIDPNFLTILINSISSLIMVFGGIYGYVGVVLTNPALVIEGLQTSVKGIQRSWELTTGSRCYLFCCLFVLYIMNDLLTRLLHHMFSSGDTVMDVLFSVAGIVVQAVPMLIFFPLHAILETVMYLNLRIGWESMNHQVLSGDLMSDTAPASRFRNDDAAVSSSSYEGPSMDYRHVPLMDLDDGATPMIEPTTRTEMV